MLNDIPTNAMTIPKLTIKGQKVGSELIPGNPHSFPKILGTILLLISLGNKKQAPHNSSTPFEMDHICLQNVYLPGHSNLLRWPTFCLRSVLSLSINILLTDHFLPLALRHKEPELQ